MTSEPPPSGEPDRVSRIMEYLNDPTLDLPDDLKRRTPTAEELEELDRIFEEHPFFMNELPDPSKPLPPLLDAFQQLKYSETENEPHELAVNHKEDGLFQFKLRKYRIASACFTTSLANELKGDDPDPKFVAQVYNNRSACSWYLRNYRSCVNDCRKALTYDPTYFKAFKRCVLALAELGRWGDVEELCAAWQGDGEAQFQFVSEMRVKARNGKVRAGVEKRRAEVREMEGEAKRNALMGKIRERGIRMRDEAFLSGEAAGNGRVVRLREEDGGLEWPVLLLYPQYSQSDFVEGFSEEDSFEPHLNEMLDGDNAPAWDVDAEYRSGTVDVYYLGDKFVRVNPSSTLLSVMKEGSYVLPGNGVPCFFVLARGNKFCEDFIERVEVE